MWRDHKRTIILVGAAVMLAGVVVFWYVQSPDRRHIRELDSGVPDGQIEAIGALAVDAAAAEQADLAARVLEMTGARTRVVWIHQMMGKEYPLGPKAPGEGPAHTEQPIFEIMAFDTADGITRVLVPGPGFCCGSKLTPDGRRVVYNDMQDGMIYVVNWDGSGRRPVTKGYARCTWKNPADGSQWVYFSDANSITYRCRLDDPDVRQVMWDKNTHSINSVAADGLHSSIVAWPQMGLAVLPNESLKILGTGCWECIAPDNSYRLFHMGGEADDKPEIANHTGLVMYDGGGLNKRYVPYNLPGRERTPCWSARWTNDVRFMVLSCPWTSAEQDLYLGEFSDDFNSFKRWIKITDQPNQDFYADVWIDPGLGRFEGEAPFAAEFEAPAAGDAWQWDYGDGAKETAAKGRHTYQKPGRYQVTARRGNAVRRGSVLVRKNLPPEIIGVNIYDERRLGVTFNKLIEARDPSISAASGVVVEGWRVHPELPELIVTLGGALPRTDALRLGGVFNTSHNPLPLADGKVNIVRPSWPATREGLVFLWETNLKPNLAYDPDSDLFRPLAIERLTRSHAMFDRWGAVSFDGGALSMFDAGKGIVRPCGDSNQFTLQATITPANIYQGMGGTPRRIIGCIRYGRNPNDVNFALDQEANTLVFSLRHNDPENNRPAGVSRLELCTLAGQSPNHVVLTCAPGAIACFLNGKLVKKIDEVKGSLAWTAPPPLAGLHFAGMATPAEWWDQVQRLRRSWHGKLEGVAIYSRALSPDEAAREYAAYSEIIAQRRPAPQVEMEVKLAAKSAIPTPTEISPYRDALVVNEYDVLRIERGTYKPKKIRVAQWGLTNAQPTALAAANLGDTATLAVEPFEDHPELEAEVRRDTLQPDHDLALYVDVTLRPSGAPRTARLVIHPGEIWLPPGQTCQFSTEAFDQYDNAIAGTVKWSVAGGGQINAGTLYSAGALLKERAMTGSGTIDANGLFTCKALGVLTVTATSANDPAVKTNGTVAITDYPAINPTRERSPLTFGSGFTGDIDRVRIYSRALTPEEIADHANGKGLDKPDAALVGDWTFDRGTDGVFPEARHQDLAAKLVHLDDKKLGPITEDGRTFFRFDGRCHLEVAPNTKLDFFRTATLEAWMRTKAGGTIIRKQIVWALGFVFWADGGGLHADALRSGLDRFADGKTNVTNGEWAHVAAVLDTSGHWLLYADGKLVGERRTCPVVTFP